MSVCVVCVCVCKKEREREGVYVCVCVACFPMQSQFRVYLIDPHTTTHCQYTLATHTANIHWQHTRGHTTLKRERERGGRGGREREEIPGRQRQNKGPTG